MSDKNVDDNIIEYKFILVGDSSSGKQSFFKKITTDEFNKKNISTIGSDRRTLFFKDIEIELNGIIKTQNFNILLYDTAGQERYRAITKTYFKGSDVIILFYDITNRKSFENIEVWLESISQVLSNWKNSNYIIGLIGNKLDLVENSEKERQVTEEEAEKLCKENEIIWSGEISTKEFSQEQLKEIVLNLWKLYIGKFGLKEAKEFKKIQGKHYMKKYKTKKGC